MEAGREEAVRREAMAKLEGGWKGMQGKPEQEGWGEEVWEVEGRG